MKDGVSTLPRVRRGLEFPNPGHSYVCPPETGLACNAKAREL